MTLVSNKNSECSLGVTTTFVVIIARQNAVTKIPVSVLKKVRKTMLFFELKEKSNNCDSQTQTNPSCHFVLTLR